MFKVHEHMLSTLAATDQWSCRWRSAWTQPRQKLTLLLIVNLAVHQDRFCSNSLRKLV